MTARTVTAVTDDDTTGLIKKTCRNYSRGACIFGDECNHLHVGDVAQTSPPRCRNYIKGSCYNGDACKYSHDGAIVKQKPPPLCRDFIAGTCELGAECRRTHSSPSTTENATPQQICRFFAKSPSKCRNGDSCRFRHILRNSSADVQSTEKSATQALSGKTIKSNRKTRTKRRSLKKKVIQTTNFDFDAASQVVTTSAAHQAVPVSEASEMEALRKMVEVLQAQVVALTVQTTVSTPPTTIEPRPTLALATTQQSNRQPSLPPGNASARFAAASQLVSERRAVDDAMRRDFFEAQLYELHLQQQLELALGVRNLS